MAEMLYLIECLKKWNEIMVLQCWQTFYRTYRHKYSFNLPWFEYEKDLTKYTTVVVREDYIQCRDRIRMC